MFDFAGSEILLIGIVALVAIGPKDLPVAIKAVSQVVKKARKMAGEFQTHVDEMVREADLGDARTAFNDLRRMDIKGKILKAVDGDGTISRSLKDPGSSFAPSPPPVPVHDIVQDIPLHEAPGPEMPGVEPSGTEPPVPLSEVSVAPLPMPSEALSSDPAPAFVPPRYAPASAAPPSRVPPAFIPPAYAAAAPSRPV